LVDGLNEGDIVDITVTAVDLNGCLNPVQAEVCTAQDCPTFVIDVTASELAVCFMPGISIQLSQVTTLDGNPANGVGMWEGDLGLDPDTGEFIPQDVGTYVLTYSFEQDGTSCPGNESITIDVLESPESAYTQDFEQICIEDEVTFTLDGVYNPAYNYTWGSTFPDDDYDLIDNGDGTFTVQFYDEGTGEFTLLTSVAGCESPETTTSVEVGLVPELPVITCTEDLSYILFEWNDVPCVENYLIYINDDFVGMQDETEYELTGLDPNETIDIRVEIESNCLCEFPDSVSETCTAQDCADAVITIDQSVPQEYCSSELPVFTITAEVEGVDIDNTGTFTWSGVGVDENGNIDFSGLVPGFHTLVVEYFEDDCSYNESITFEVFADPILSVQTINAPCPGALGMVEVTGDGNGPFEFNTTGNSLQSGSNELQAGNYDVIITDANGCEIESSFTIGVDAEPSDDLVVSNDFINLGEEVNVNYSIVDQALENVIWTVNGEEVADFDCENEDCFNLNYAPTEGGSYEVCTYAYYDGANCELVECRTFNVLEVKFNSYYIPNVITPDNETDPLNTALTIFVEGDAVTIHSVGIYDRWGNRLYHNDEEMTVNGDEQAILWDGRFEEDGDYIAGVYVYLIETEINGIKEWDTNDITVVR